MLLRFGQIVHPAFAFQMSGQRVAAPRFRSRAAVGRCGRVFVVGAVSVVLRQVFHVHAQSFPFGFEQRQLFFGNLFAATVRLQLPEQVLVLILRACSASSCAIRSSTIRRSVAASLGSCL